MFRNVLMRTRFVQECSKPLITRTTAGILQHKYNRWQKTPTQSHLSYAAKVGIQDNFQIFSKFIEVHSPKWDRKLKLNLLWLRDNCQCSICKDPTTGMRSTGLNNEIFDQSASQIEETTIDANCLKIKWANDHTSVYDLNWLWDNCYDGNSKENRPMKKVLWDASIAKKVPFEEVQYEDLISSEDAVRKFLSSILNYGISIVQNVPATNEHTRLAMERFGPVWQTFWGEIYHVVADLSKHSHPSYTGGDLAFHTDTNYYFEGAGLQAFHVLEHSGTGGKNKFVDGFFVAQKIKEKHPDVYEYLSKTPVSFKYIEPNLNLHLINEDVLLKHHPVTKELMQLRYTPYDFDIFRTVRQEFVDQYYHSLHVLIKAIKDSAHTHYIQLKPGSVLVTDNWRVLHGRTEFTGKRVLCGMYVSHSDFLSRARNLHLL